MGIEGNVSHIYTPHRERRFNMRPSRVFCSVAARVVALMKFQRETFLEMVKADEGGGCCVYVSGLLCCVMKVNKRVFIPLIFRTGRGDPYSLGLIVARQQSI